MKANWIQLFNGVVEQLHPLFAELRSRYAMNYYWACSQSEWATDIVFRDANRLRRLYPQLVHLGMTSFSSPDVLRFMGKKVTREGTPLGRYEVPLSSDFKVRPQGVRIKHRYGANSIDKAYDDRGAVLRAEVTILKPELFRVYRPTQDDHDSPCRWQRMRRDGKPYRAIHPFEEQDHALLRAINRGEFAIHGLRNRDLQALLYSSTPSHKSEQRCRSAAISRKLRLLRAHGLIRKLPHTHRYKVTDAGRLILNAILSAHRLTAQQLTTIAA
jgi:hypothetical protein